jgi:phage shock protein A
MGVSPTEEATVRSPISRIATGCAIVAAVAGIGWISGLGTTARAWITRAGEGIQRSKSNEQLIAEIQIQLADMDEEINRHQVALSRVKRQVEAAEQEVTDLARRRDRELEILRKARSLFAEDRETYLIGGKRVSRSDLSADMLVRVGNVKSYSQQLDTRQTIAKSLREAIEKGEALLAEAKATRSKKQGEMVVLKARLENAHQLARIDEMTEGLRNSPLTRSRNGLRDNFEQIRGRIEEMEIRMNSRVPEPVTWDEKSPARDALAEVDELLNATRTATPVVRTK